MLKLKPCAYGMAIALLPASALADRTVASTAPVTAPANVANTSAESPKPLEAAPPLDDEEPDRLLLPGKVKHGGYGAPEVKFTTMTGDPAVLVGFQGGWIINHGFVIGAAGYGLSTTHDAPSALSLPNTRSTLQFGYGGPRLGYVIRPHDVVHASLGLLVGGGGYTILSRDIGTDESQTHDGRGFFVMEPQAELEANMLRFLRAGFSVSYRYVGTKDVPQVATRDLSGPAASVFVKFGSF
jgi:hypothetical protein